MIKLIPHFQDLVDPLVRSRGYIYYKNGYVEIQDIQENQVAARVRGENTYHVTISANWQEELNKHQLNGSCTCPFASQGFYCKHLWATILEIERPRRGTPYVATPMTGTSDRGWRKDLSLLEKGHAAGFIDSSTERLADYHVNVQKSQFTRSLCIEVLTKENLVSSNLKAWGRGKKKRISNTDIFSFVDGLDREILGSLLGTTQQQYYSARAASEFYIDENFHLELIKKISQTGRLFIKHALQSQPLAADFTNTFWHLKLKGEVEFDELIINGFLYSGSEEVPLSKLDLLLSSGICFSQSLIMAVDPKDETWFNVVKVKNKFRVPKSEWKEFVEHYFRIKLAPPLELPASLPFDIVMGEPEVRAVFRLPKEGQKKVFLNLEFFYKSEPAGLRVEVRNPAAEEGARQKLVGMGFIQGNSFGEHNWEIDQKEFPRAVSELLALGYRVEAQGKSIRGMFKSETTISSGIDWFDLSAEFNYGDGQKINLPALLTAYRQDSPLILLGDGSYGVLPEEWLKKYSTLLAVGKASTNELRFKSSQALLLSHWIKDDGSVNFDEKFRNVRTQLTSFNEIKLMKASKKFRGTLRPYQEKGLGWLQYLRELKLGGILADDMGLGKTIQVLAQLVHMQAEKNPHRKPTLIIVPKSLIYNWQEEATKFAPDLKILCYQGSQRHRLAAQLNRHDVVLVTYATLRQDIENFKDVHFEYVIADEAQNIKNSQSMTHRACLLLKRNQTLALTGTPIENSLDDLFAIMNFVNPDLLGPLTRSRLVSAKTGDAAPKADPLAQALRPFILRRTKGEVLKDLPEKTEQNIYCELSESEMKEYNELKEFYRAKLSGSIEVQGFNKSKIVVLEALLRLRQAACHPGLLNARDATLASSKVETLIQQLNELVCEGHKVLVFSQFTSFLKIIQARLKSEKLTALYLDGKVVARERAELVRRFQTDNSIQCFLISLKAGGVGLNLTAADYVFVMDPWWNPAVEAQAIDRAHRIGQTRKVMAYKLIAKGTVEEKILELQKNKKLLSDSIMNEASKSLRTLTPQDLDILLS